MFGRNVELRLTEEQDLPLMVRWQNDARNRAKSFNPLLTSEARQKKWFATLLQDSRRMQFTIRRCQDQAPIGTVALEGVNYLGQTCMMGVFTMEQEARSLEAELDAGEALLTYTFLSMNLHRVEARAIASDIESLQLYEQLGFTQERVEREALYQKGRFVDVVWFGILREEWEANRQMEREAYRIAEMEQLRVMPAATHNLAVAAE